MAATVSELIDTALTALDALGSLAEEIEDEWTYVTDLVDAQRERLEFVARRREHEAAPAAMEIAIATAIEETGLITDPHRAIDWLSTFPDLVALALDEPVGGG